MALGRLNVSQRRERSLSNFRDENGRLLMTLGILKSVGRDANGVVEETKEGESIVLADGTVSNLSKILNGEMRLAQCSVCPDPPFYLFRLFWQERPSHGLIDLTRTGQNCRRCGCMTCGRHRQRIHGAYYCVRCAPRVRKSWFSRFLRFLFFRRIN